MVAVSTLMSGAHVRSLRRKAAFEALTGKLKTAYGRIHELEAIVAAQHVVGKADAVITDTDEELIARLAAIKPCLEEQMKYYARSPTGLVSPQMQLFANAAKHNFSSDFRSLSAKEARLQQRGERRHNVLLMPPPPPPPHLPELQNAINWSNLEDFRRGLYSCAIAGGVDISSDTNGGMDEVISSGILIDEASMVFSLQEDDLSVSGPQATVTNSNGDNNDDNGVTDLGVGAPLPEVYIEPNGNNINSQVTDPNEKDSGAPSPVNYVTEDNDKDRGIIVTDTIVKENDGGPLPEKFVTEANDEDMCSTVTDANDNENDIGAPLPEN